MVSREAAEGLRAAGWTPGRRVDAAEWLRAFARRGLVAHEAAGEFLAEFGGLRSISSGPGITCAREPFDLDPMCCLGEEDRFLEWGAELGKSLFPIGELAEGRFFLGIDEDATVYLVETWVASFGRMPTAIEHLLLGMQPVLVDDGSD